jgi:hypothetical protein
MTTQTEEVVVENPLALSDEDFLNQTPPGVELEEVSDEGKDKSGEAAGETAATAVVDESNTTQVAQTTSKDDLNNVNVQANAEVQQDGKKDAATASESAASTTVDASKTTQAADPKAASTAGDSSAAGSQNVAVDYESEYKRLMAPFKANGKQIELRSIDEAIQLMQMGANYTRKMQDITPHRKTLMMLESAQLMDPAKLAFLIDVNNGDQKAIQKLLKDKSIDPMSIDTSEDSNYLGGNHQVSDEEVNLRNALDDIRSTPEGVQTLTAVNSTWDQASKEELWKDPEILGAIHNQRENGIYARIEAEVSRLRTLGQIRADLPFIKAYQAVGEAMQAKGAFNDLVAPPSGSTATAASATAEAAAAVKEPVATRVAAPKTTVANGDQASAAAATRSTPREVKKLVNPLAMSDDEFLKTFENRV